MVPVFCVAEPETPRLPLPFGGAAGVLPVPERLPLPARLAGDWLNGFSARAGGITDRVMSKTDNPATTMTIDRSIPFNFMNFVSISYLLACPLPALIAAGSAVFFVI